VDFFSRSFPMIEPRPWGVPTSIISLAFPPSWYTATTAYHRRLGVHPKRSGPGWMPEGPFDATKKRGNNQSARLVAQSCREHSRAGPEPATELPSEHETA